jgi:protein-S-isoprenylcysteine O-methyltransferase Ste14
MNFFDYFQIAISGTVLLIILGKASYLLLVRHVNPIALASGGKGPARVIEAVAFFGLIVWLIEILSYAFHSRTSIFPPAVHFQLFDSSAAKVGGVVLTSLGLVLFMLALFAFGDSWRVGIDRESPGTLVTSGVFAVSRNPIYVFFDLWCFGVFLINGTLFFLIFAVLGVVVLHWQILREEKFLLQQYGEPYRAYCAHTPRYLIW